jgi:hypothetical protein
MTHAQNPSSPSGILKSNRGGLSFGCLLVLVLLVALGFVGFKVGEVYWNYFDVKEKVREVLNWAVAGKAKSNQEITEKVLENIRGAGLNIPPGSIRITHSKDDLRITVKWKREVVFPGYTLPLNLEVDLTEIKRWERGGLVIK